MAPAKKAKQMDPEEEPYKTTNVKIMDVSYVDQVALEAADSCIFKGKFKDKDQKTVGTVILPDIFFDFNKAPGVIEVFEKVGLDGYFKLDLWGVDTQRAYELMTTIDEDGVATLTSKSGEATQVQIFEDLIIEALHLPHSERAVRVPHQLTEIDKKAIFLIITNKKETFNGLLVKEIDFPLRLYSQHFIMGKPQKYT